MIAACPTCKTKFRIANERLRPEGVRLRCTQCSAVFRVKAPVAAPEPLEPTVDAEQTPQPRALDPEKLVVVAIADADLGKQAAAAVEDWGLHSAVTFDGVEAVLTIQRMLPRAVVLDAALPKMFGFQVCELLKRNESLKHIKVVLVGAIHHPDRYRRTPGELYGADLYLESQDLPEGLRPALQDFGLPFGGTPTPTPVPSPPLESVPEPGPEPAAAPEAPAMPEPAPAPEAPAPAPASADPLAEAREKARRLARIIVSDVVLYNEDKFRAAVATGNVEQAMNADLAEGRALFQSRTDPRILEECDYLREELLRVATERA